MKYMTEDQILDLVSELEYPDQLPEADLYEYLLKAAEAIKQLMKSKQAAEQHGNLDLPGYAYE